MAGLQGSWRDSCAEPSASQVPQQATLIWLPTNRVPAQGNCPGVSFQGQLSLGASLFLEPNPYEVFVHTNVPYRTALQLIILKLCYIKISVRAGVCFGSSPFWIHAFNMNVDEPMELFCTEFHSWLPSTPVIDLLGLEVAFQGLSQHCPVEYPLNGDARDFPELGILCLH